MTFAISRAGEHALPRLPFKKIAEAVLGPAYDLSVAFVPQKTMRSLNRRFRHIDAPTDILSFALSKNSGELFFSLPDVEQKAKRRGMTRRAYLGFLFIHGCLHLEGRDHGRTMESLERRFCRVFGFPVAR